MSLNVESCKPVQCHTGHHSSPSQAGVMMTERTASGEQRVGDPRSPWLPEQTPGSLAAHLYRTIDLDVAAIAARVRVSRLTVVRWLRREGISLRTKRQQAPCRLDKTRCFPVE